MRGWAWNRRKSHSQGTKGEHRAQASCWVQAWDLFKRLGTGWLVCGYFWCARFALKDVTCIINPSNPTIKYHCSAHLMGEAEGLDNDPSHKACRDLDAGRLYPGFLSYSWLLGMPLR